MRNLTFNHVTKHLTKYKNSVCSFCILFFIDFHNDVLLTMQINLTP